MPTHVPAQVSDAAALAVAEALHGAAADLHDAEQLTAAWRYRGAADWWRGAWLPPTDGAAEERAAWADAYREGWDAQAAWAALADG